MQISSINAYSTNFKGYTKYYRITDDMYSRYDCRHLQLSDTPISEYPPSYSELFEDKFRQMIYPNVKVEKTGTVKATGKIYIADPMEGISDEIRKSVDYVIHDVEPKYPDVNAEVSKEYFFRVYGKDKYLKHFEAIRDYYTRLKAADLRTLAELKLQNRSREINDKIDYYSARIADSEYKQTQAQECIDIYNKSRELRNQKYMLEEEIASLESSKNSCKNTDLKPSDLKIEKNVPRTAPYEKDMAVLENRKRLYQELIDLPEELNSDVAPSKNYQFKNEKFALSEKIKVIDELIQKCKQRITREINIAKYFDELSIQSKMTVGNYMELIKEKEALLSDVKARLIPLFDELKHFYAKQGIRRI